MWNHLNFCLNKWFSVFDVATLAILTIFDRKVRFFAGAISFIVELCLCEVEFSCIVWNMADNKLYNILGVTRNASDTEIKKVIIKM